MGPSGQAGSQLALLKESEPELAALVDYNCGNHLAKNVGNHALDGLRMEKQYMISRDLTHDVTPDEAGL